MKYAIILVLLLSFNASASGDCKYILDATQSFKKAEPKLYAAILEEAVVAYEECRDQVDLKETREKHSIGTVQHTLSYVDTEMNAAISNTKALIHSGAKFVSEKVKPRTE